MPELMIIRYGNGSQIVEVSGRTKTGKLQLAARYSVTRNNGNVYVERKTTTAKVYPEVVLTSQVLEDWRGRYVINHFTGVATKTWLPEFSGRDITVQ